MMSFIIMFSQELWVASPGSDAAAVKPNVVPGGVPPLRAGEGHSFFWRRLHSLTGIVPVGVYLIEHFISNAFATNGPEAYTDQVKFLTGLPFAFWLELFGIWLPIAFHGVYGIYIWWRGDSNAGPAYPWTGNWMYTAQRWTGIIAFAFILYHTWYMRFTGVHLFDHPDAAFWKVQNEFQNPWAVAAYAVGIVAASWHFGYGLFLFAAKWGLVVGEKARRRMQLFGVAVSLLFIVVGIAIMWAFLRPKPEWPKQEFKPEWTQPKHSRVLQEPPSKK
jgi:succinate dehydrogenase / fumarate reductase cytochrome b subunit